MNKRALLLCALAAPGLAAAADGDEWYVTPFLGGTHPDYRRDVDQISFDWGMAVGRELGPIFNVELSSNAGVDMLAVGNRTGTVSPYIGFGMGAVRTDYSFDGNCRPGYDTRLGLETEVGLM